MLTMSLILGIILLVIVFTFIVVPRTNNIVVVQDGELKTCRACKNTYTGFYCPECGFDNA